MEQTMGKRIAQNRKRLGLTQDQLAEKLGVTAQAVSKWENDQSCPDITMLPKLAQIFGISIDALLGHTTEEPVHEAEFLEEEEKETDGLHVQKGNWEFQWGSGRQGAVAFAVLVLLTGVLTLAARLWEWEASFWSILWPTGLLVFGLKEVFGRRKRKFSFFGLGMTVVGGYYLVENLGFWKLDVGSELIFPVIIVLLGISLLADALRKPAKPRFRVTHKGQENQKECHCFNDEDGFRCELSFGENTHRVALPRLAGGEASVSFGELTLDLRECEQVDEDCTVAARCSFGEMTLLVPKRFRVEEDSSTAFGTVTFSGSPDPDPRGVICLDCSVSFGEICVKYL